MGAIQWYPDTVPEPRLNDGATPRCWVHLLRYIHDLRVLYTDDAPRAQWAHGVHQLYRQAKAFTHTR